MKRTIRIALATAGLCAAMCTGVSAQNAKDIVGAWETTSITSERADGSKFSPITGRLKGLVVFTSDGHFSQHNVNLDMPKIAANNRQQSTAEENKAIMQGSYALFGRYTVDETDHTLAIQSKVAPFRMKLASRRSGRLRFPATS